MSRSCQHARHAALFVVTALAPFTAAKVVDGVVALSSQTTEQYIAKFSFSPGVKSTIGGSFHTDEGYYFDAHPHELTLTMFAEKEWNVFQKMLKSGSLCNERQRIATWQSKIVPKYIAVPGGAPKHDFTFEARMMPPDSASKSTHYWFAVIMDCYLEEYDAHPPPMKFKLTFLNGHSHLPADEDGMSYINSLALVCLIIYGAFYFSRLYLQWKRMQQGHLITLLFAFAYLNQCAALLSEILHLRRFAQDGKGLRWRHTFFALDFVSGISQSISELTISLLLIALAFGWTLGLESQEPLEGHVGKLLAAWQRPGHLIKAGFSSSSSLLLLSIGVVQLLLQALGRRYEEDFNNFHDHEHWPGLTLIGIRLMLCALFSWALRRSLRVETQKEVVSFLSRLRILGVMWFVCLPALVLGASALPPYRRHQLVAGGSILLQSCALALLSILFMEKSEYYKISSLAHMGSALGGGFSTAVGGSKKIAID